jgi:hypothetical protein
MKRCRPPGDRKPCIIRSRFRIGRCEFSARLFHPLCGRCSTSGMTYRFAAPYDRSLSVMMRFGASPCFFRSRISKRLAALVFRRVWTISSRTKPSWSTARQSSVFGHRWKLQPRPDARYHSAKAFCRAVSGQRRDRTFAPIGGWVWWETTIPRSNSISSTNRRLKGKRK